MADEVVLNDEQKIEAAETAVGAGFWDGKAAPVSEEKTIVEEQKEVIQGKVIEIPTEWLKKEFDVEDPAILKAEREELKQLKSVPRETEKIVFADEQSKHIHELLREGKPENKKAVREFLQIQEQLEELSSITDVNKENASDIIKLQMKLQNKNLLPSEIEFQYKQNYVAPKEPIQKEGEDEEDFKERHDEWKEINSNVEMKRIIAAKMAQPELSKLKTEIALPEIEKKQIQPEAVQQSQEDLEAEKKQVNDFVQSVENSLKIFNEISVLVKDEAVEIPVTYAFSPEEKAKVNSQLKTLAENNFNSNAVFAERWINDDKTFNVSRMIRDLAILNSEDKMSQKFATDAANQRLKEYTKEKKNIQLPGASAHQNGALDANKALEEVESAMWSR